MREVEVGGGGGRLDPEGTGAKKPEYLGKDEGDGCGAGCR